MFRYFLFSYVCVNDFYNIIIKNGNDYDINLFLFSDQSFIFKHSNILSLLIFNLSQLFN